MSTEHNKQVMRRTFDELFSGGNLSIADELVTADCLNHELPPDALLGPAGLRWIVTMLRASFPDLRYDIEEFIAEGDTVVARTRLNGTHLGSYFGIAPTGRTVAQSQVHIVRFVDGKGAEHRAIRDDLGLLRQLGAIPTPERAKA